MKPHFGKFPLNILNLIKSSLLQSGSFLFFSIAQSYFPLPSFIVSAVKYQSHTLFAFQKRKSYLEPSCIAWHGTFNPPVNLHLIFEKCNFKTKLDELDFWSISNLICTASLCTLQNSCSK